MILNLQGQFKVYWKTPF